MSIKCPLSHDVPFWIREPDEIFFLTICCKSRGGTELVKNGVAEKLIESVAFRNESRLWWCSGFVVMPDHVHGLIQFPSGRGMKHSIQNWKAWNARQLGVKWQRDWFDHRLRADESWRKTADYLINNPVRAGLVDEASDWPYQFYAER